MTGSRRSIALSATERIAGERRPNPPLSRERSGPEAFHEASASGKEVIPKVITQIPPEPVCYEVFDLETGEPLGAGKDWSGVDEEMVLLVTGIEWTLNTKRQVHVEQISYEQYEQSFGREPNWPSEWQTILAERM